MWNSRFLLLFIPFVVFFKGSLYAQSTVRYATKDDVGKVKNAVVGDLLITGGTEKTKSGLPAIYIGPKSDWTVKPGNKILIKGDVYEWISIHVPSAGTAKQPIIVTNYDGQVESETFELRGLRNFKLTGKYDPINKTGDKKYQGHANGYAFTQGKYGFFINNKWSNTKNLLLEISGYSHNGVDHPTSDYEIEFIESGNGGYSNVFKWNGKTNIVDNVKIHDCYFHDTGGEAIYLGNTDWSTSQEVFRNFSFYNNRLLRARLDGLQLNRIGENSNIYNNVIDGGMDWRSPFMETQDFGASLSFVNGNVSFRNNIIINGSGAFYQSHFRPEPWYSKKSKITGTVTFENNLYLNTKSAVGVYLGPGNMNLEGVSVHITKNDFNKFTFIYDQVYPDWEDEDCVITGWYKGIVNIDNNRWDGSKGKSKIFKARAMDKVTVENNTMSAIENIQFENYLGNGVGYANFDYWTDEISVGKYKNKAVTYKAGSYVCYKSKIYKCIAENSSIEPGVSAGWTKTWALLVFNNGTSFLPADDVRVKETNYHYKLNRGLLPGEKYLQRPTQLKQQK